MKSVRSERGSTWAILTIGLAAATEIVIRESVHRVSSQLLPLTVLVVVVAGMTVLDKILSRRASQSRAATVLSRLPLALTVAAYVELMLGGVIGFNLQLFGVAISTPIRASLAALCGLLFCYIASADQWVALRRALTAAAILFVGAQPLLVAFNAPTLSWPPQSQMSKAQLTVFVLLDEWNAKDSPAVESALRRAGLNTSWRPVQPIGDATSKVIPALFTRQRFDAVKPCDLYAVCSEDQILDFSQIIASRPDVDVVGFYHPYCSVRGLRWCYRGVVSLDFTNVDRWRCAIMRRTGWTLGSTDELCDRTFRAPWNTMTEEVLAAVWRAPGWSQGGWMFLHLPLPHPPGRLLRQGLIENYEDGVRRAAVMAEGMARLALSKPDRHVTFVFFSDHPLRQAQWCKQQWVFSSIGCSVDPAHVDQGVPLLVASNGALPSLDFFNTNRDVFDIGSKGSIPRMN